MGGRIHRQYISGCYFAVLPYSDLARANIDFICLNSGVPQSQFVVLGNLKLGTSTILFIHLVANKEIDFLVPSHRYSVKDRLAATKRGMILLRTIKTERAVLDAENIVGSSFIEICALAPVCILLLRPCANKSPSTRLYITLLNIHLTAVDRRRVIPVVHSRTMHLDIAQIHNIIRPRLLVSVDKIADLRIAVAFFLLVSNERECTDLDVAVLKRHTTAIDIQFPVTAYLKSIRLHGIRRTALRRPPIVLPPRRSLVVVLFCKRSQCELCPVSMQLGTVCIDGIPADTERCFTAILMLYRAVEVDMIPLHTAIGTQFNPMIIAVLPHKAVARSHQNFCLIARIALQLNGRIIRHGDFTTVDHALIRLQRAPCDVDGAVRCTCIVHHCAVPRCAVGCNCFHAEPIDIRRAVLDVNDTAAKL